MSDFSRSFDPWENSFSQGLHPAGVKCKDGSEGTWGLSGAIPAYEYLHVGNEGADIFPEVMEYLRLNHISLAGAVSDLTCPETGKGPMFSLHGK